jgi:hypothetical protein
VKCEAKVTKLQFSLADRQKLLTQAQERMNKDEEMIQGLLHQLHAFKDSVS